VFETFRHTPATKETHCYSWMYAEVLGPYACSGSLAHVAAGGTPLRLLEIGFHRGDSALLWKSMFPGSELHAIDNGAQENSLTDDFMEVQVSLSGCCQNWMACVHWHSDDCCVFALKLKPEVEVEVAMVDRHATLPGLGSHYTLGTKLTSSFWRV
jgi:hypothetical protein